ncbi:MAG: hypothetical protein ABI696_03410 [Rubrivivax sp.]
MPLPHERDEGARGSTTEAPVDGQVAQAAKDLAAGQVDTDMRATPGLDAVRRRQLVAPPSPPPASATPIKRKPRKG